MIRRCRPSVPSRGSCISRGLYQKLLDLKPSPRNALEFCVGSLAEMTEGDIYETVETYAGKTKSPTSTFAMCAAKCRITRKRSSTKVMSISTAFCESSSKRVSKVLSFRITPRK